MAFSPTLEAGEVLRTVETGQIVVYEGREHRVGFTPPEVIPVTVAIEDLETGEIRTVPVAELRARLTVAEPELVQDDWVDSSLSWPTAASAD
jgi:hypothetical protein